MDGKLSLVLSAELVNASERNERAAEKTADVFILSEGKGARS